MGILAIIGATVYSSPPLTSGAAPSADALLMESGDYLLLESNDKLLLE